jgi:hypothetical protein
MFGGENSVIVNKQQNAGVFQKNKATLRQSALTCICPKCGVVLAHGKWQWPTNLLLECERKECPACLRTRTKKSAGLLTMSGEFVKNHRTELLMVAYKDIESRKVISPLRRLIQFEQLGERVLIMSFTDNQSPLGVGKAIVKEFNGKLEIHHNRVKDFVRANWRG